jgi:hypothetical protein
MCESFGTNHVDEEVIDRLVHDVFDLRPARILENLRLRRPIYKNTAAYGHFRSNGHRRALGADRQGRGAARQGGHGSRRPLGVTTVRS